MTTPLRARRQPPSSMLGDVMIARECFCPTCGAPRQTRLPIDVDAVRSRVTYEGKTVRMAPKLTLAFQALAGAYPRGIEPETMFRALYGTPHNGGPLSDMLASNMSRLRKALGAAGWPFKIRKERGMGYFLELGGVMA